MYRHGQTISHFTGGLSGNNNYDIIYVGDVIRNYANSSIAKLLKEDYVFLFSTKNLTNPDSEYNGRVHIGLIKDNKTPYFCKAVSSPCRYHRLGYEGLMVNDFLEICLEKIAEGIQIVANLKSQGIFNSKGELIAKKDLKILLVEENIMFDNKPVLTLAKEFQLMVDFTYAEERYNRWKESEMHLLSLLDEAKTEEEKTSLQKAYDLITIECERKYCEQKEALDRYLDYSKSLKYSC